MSTASEEHPLRAPSAAPPALPDRTCSLQWKATLLVVALTVFMTAAVSGYLLRCSESLAKQQHRTQMSQAAALLSRGASVAIANGDRIGLEALARQAVTGSPLRRVTITDPEGVVLVDATTPGLARWEWPALFVDRAAEDDVAAVPGAAVSVPQSNSPDDSLLTIAYPITDRRKASVDPGAPGVELLGYVRTAMATGEWRRSMSSRVDLLVGVGLLATLAAVPLGFLLIRRIVAPMRGLAAVMTKFSEGKLDVRSPIEREDEIGLLARAFNQMADEHERTHSRLVRLNAELEERVAFRTRQLRELASRDPLTGLYNRRHFNEVLERRFAEALRYDSELACLMIDLDEFKSANDQLGHQLGDALLSLAATTIVSQLRTSDVAARFGGDEFIILLPQTNLDRARILAERIMEKFARDVTERYPGLAVRMSVGIAGLGSRDGSDAESLVRAADQALYRAKETGKNRIVLASAETAAPRT